MRKSGGVILTLLRIFFRSPATFVGATMLALLFPILVLSTFFDLQGGIGNPYFSLLIYLVLGPLAAIALIIIAIGLLHARAKGDQGPYTYEYFKEQLTSPDRYNRIRRVVYTSTFLISSFLLFLGIVAYSGHSYTDSVQFCGNFCHNIMGPELITYQNSPHSRVSCVDCHIGQEAGGLTAARLTGLKQLYATVSGTYPRPLKTPLDNLRPTRQICEECHRPEKFHGQKLYVIDTFLPDAQNSRVQTAMIMKIGSGGYLGRSAHGIHWHISERHQLLYEAVDKGRREITRVILKDASGNSTVYYRKGANPSTGTTEHLMDCIDCHNRPTHIFLSPGEALDQKLLARQIPAKLPFIKREALAAITQNYKDTQSARKGIAERLRQWYLSNYPKLAASRSDLVDQAIQGAQQAYTENVFPEMNIGWETYQDFIGHRNGGGCFRCHDGSFESADGKTISRDCDLCHIILAENKPAESILEMMHAFRR